MDHFIDIRVLPDPEFQPETLMNALYAKLHRALVQTALGQIGVSFPQHKKTLGDTLRLHGSKAHLIDLMALSWLQGLRDYTQCSELTSVPDAVSHRHVKRIQAKSANNKRMRSINKGWLTLEQAFERIPEDQQKRLTLPYAQIKSLSTGQPMRIYIEHCPLLEKPKTGKFSSYGLSANATIPWF